MAPAAKPNKTTRRTASETSADPGGLSGEIDMLRTVMHRLAELGRSEESFESQAIVLRVLSLAAGRLATLVRTQALLNKIETSAGRQLFDEALADMLAQIQAEREQAGADLTAANPTSQAAEDQEGTGYAA